MIYLLVAATAVAGALLPWALPGRESFDPVILGILAVLSAASGMRSVKPAGRGTWFVPTDAFVLAGIVTVGGRAACALALIGLLGMGSGLTGPLAPRRAVFNVGAVLTATVAAAFGFASFHDPKAAFAAACATFFVVNTGLVAAAIALDRSESWALTWRRTFLPAVPRFALAAALGAALVCLASWGGPAPVLLLGSIPCLSASLARSLTTP